MHRTSLQSFDECDVSLNFQSPIDTVDKSRLLVYSPSRRDLVGSTGQACPQLQPRDKRRTSYTPSEGVLVKEMPERLASPP
ncbi:hypothetical protein RRG08_002065 [Elysia crispata]|uniref:Uncharacterized protein n=1 Tax=Elysia crispata TaxID=231223 RepID=A0AAE1DHR2_9GAST|nr:hypothetical protein RRG08_002065 [Elysia crispata]